MRAWDRAGVWRGRANGVGGGVGMQRKGKWAWKKPERILTRLLEGKEKERTQEWHIKQRSGNNRFLIYSDNRCSSPLNRICRIYN